MYWQGETDAQCSPFRDAASSLLASGEGWKRELIGSSTPTSTLDASHSRLVGTQFLPSEKHPPYPWHILARQSVQHRGPVPSQPSKHGHPAQTAQAALAGACLPHGGWPHLKRHSLWRVGIWKEIQRPPTSALQGCLQERHEST